MRRVTVEGGDDFPLGQSPDCVAGDTFAEAVRDAAEDNDVEGYSPARGSPGGSAIASDQILQALKKARAIGAL